MKSKAIVITALPSWKTLKSTTPEIAEDKTPVENVEFSIYWVGTKDEVFAKGMTTADAAEAYYAKLNRDTLLDKWIATVKTDAAEETVPQQTGKNGDSGEQSRPSAGDPVPAHIQGIVLNPYGNPFFIPRGTIEVIFEINKKALQERKDPGTKN